MGVAPIRVLFVCTHNSARSQMAEALLREISGARFNVQSAGVEPGRLNPLAVRAMAKLNLDIADARPKSFTEFTGQRFDYIITMCDDTREACPIIPGDTEQNPLDLPRPLGRRRRRGGTPARLRRGGGRSHEPLAPLGRGRQARAVDPGLARGISHQEHG